MISDFSTGDDAIASFEKIRILMSVVNKSHERSISVGGVNIPPGIA